VRPLPTHWYDPVVEPGLTATGGAPPYVMVSPALIVVAEKDPDSCVVSGGKL
jgi:hypothetical protein